MGEIECVGESEGAGPGDSTFKVVPFTLFLFDEGEVVIEEGISAEIRNGKAAEVAEKDEEVLPEKRVETRPGPEGEELDAAEEAEAREDESG